MLDFFVLSPYPLTRRGLPHMKAKRWGVPQDVADAVLYFASQEASFVTGQTLCVNGGMTPW